MKTTPKIVHAPCRHPARGHDNQRCPDPLSPYYTPAPGLIRRLDFIAAWTASHTMLNTATWMLALCLAMAVTAQLIGIRR